MNRIRRSHQLKLKWIIIVGVLVMILWAAFDNSLKIQRYSIHPNKIENTVTIPRTFNPPEIVVIELVKGN